MGATTVKVLSSDMRVCREVKRGCAVSHHHRLLHLCPFNKTSWTFHFFFLFLLLFHHQSTSTSTAPTIETLIVLSSLQFLFQVDHTDSAQVTNRHLTSPRILHTSDTNGIPPPDKRCSTVPAARSRIWSTHGGAASCAIPYVAVDS